MSESFVGVAKAIRQDPAVVLNRPDIDFAFEDQPSHDHINALKPELYALTALICDEVVQRAMDAKPDFPPFGLVDFDGYPVVAVNGLFGLRESFRSTLFKALDDVTGSFKEDEPLYIPRFTRLCAILHDLEYEPRYGSYQILIRSGIGTAVGAVPRALGAIARIVRNQQPNASSEQIAEVARKSKIAIIKVAGVNIDHLVAAEGLLEVAGESPDIQYTIDVQSLELKTKDDGTEYVDFKQPILNTQYPYATSTRTIATRPIKSETLGCPATAKLNGSSAVTKLWEWAIDVAEANNILVSDDIYALTDKNIRSVH